MTVKNKLGGFLYHFLLKTHSQYRLDCPLTRTYLPKAIASFEQATKGLWAPKWATFKKTRQTICAEVKHHFKTTISDLFPISKFYLKFRDDTDELEVGSNGRLQNQELSSFTKTTTEKI